MQQTPWWKEAVIYHIYPRSFYDIDGDGVGDLAGITAKLEHVRDLGADAIWMGPVFQSPQVDNGYDISDYRKIDPLFGDLEAMDRLILRAHKLGIRVLLDLVLNHTSDKHPWFQAALKDPGSSFTDYYIWRDPAPDGGPPNDWRSFFSIPAWTYVPERKQYYLHLFTPQQPDLNWDNPTVRVETAEIANYWLHRGVDGFRLDVMNLISKAPGLPSLAGASPSGIYIDGPNALGYLQEFRSRLAGDRKILLVGEAPGITPEAAKGYTDPANCALDMVLLFDHLAVDHGPSGRWESKPWRVDDLRDVVNRWQERLSEPNWPSIYLSNHDQPRIVSRYGDDGTFRFESATALATLFYLQRGTPIVYQGEEIAMRNFPLTDPEQIVDIETRNAYRDFVDHQGLSPAAALERVRPEARDNSRTPMQWSAKAIAGFQVDGSAGSTTPKTTETSHPASPVAPWYPPNPDYLEWNVEAQSSCPPLGTAGEQQPGDTTAASSAAVGAKSVLCYYRALFALRRNTPALLAGQYLPIKRRDGESESLFAFLRRQESGSQGIAVVANLSARDAMWQPPGDVGMILLRNYPAEGTEMPESTPAMLRPWECIVVTVSET